LNAGLSNRPKTARIFRLGIGDIAEVVHLPQLLREVRIGAPHCTLQTTEIPGSRLREALSEGEVDVATGDYELGTACRHVVLYESVVRVVSCATIIRTSARALR
jgi:DNA-binding transcriptional LysR family regulator